MSSSDGPPALQGEALLFEVSAEAESHGGEEFVLEVGLAAGAEALVEGRGENGHGNGFVDGGFDGPAAFAGIGDAAFEFGEGRVFHERGGGEVEQPGGDDAAAPPDFGDVADVEVVLVVFGVAERRGFGIDLVHAACRCWRL